MAQKVVTTYTDDLTGKESPEISTHEFSLNGVIYEIDLTPESYDELAADFGRYIEAGRKKKGGKSTGRTRAASGPSATEVREWARENGYEVNDRGRVPAPVREAYEAAH
ncbi:Lsr2 family protein [Streptomyces sp. NPDC046925]|uniref:histone-like nucleoid-structuring protein Lsr2 n=1 Tax=Streptomyces sp. NPDC046925 TaxID=3155375 RepID=UPI0033CD6778